VTDFLIVTAPTTSVVVVHWAGGFAAAGSGQVEPSSGDDATFRIWVVAGVFLTLTVYEIVTVWLTASGPDQETLLPVRVAVPWPAGVTVGPLTQSALLRTCERSSLTWAVA